MAVEIAKEVEGPKLNFFLRRRGSSPLKTELEASPNCCEKHLTEIFHLRRSQSYPEKRPLLGIILGESLLQDNVLRTSGVSH